MTSSSCSSERQSTVQGRVVCAPQSSPTGTAILGRSTEDRILSGRDRLLTVGSRGKKVCGVDKIRGARLNAWKDNRTPYTPLTSRQIWQFSKTPLVEGILQNGPGSPFNMADIFSCPQPSALLSDLDSLLTRWSVH